MRLDLWLKSLQSRRRVSFESEQGVCLNRSRLLKAEPWLFVAFAAICTLLSARSFFDARHSALQFAEAARHASPAESAARLVPPVRWSAPLDDVFIHFDFARSLAQGRFFEWAPGGGYSSGATSWLYPAILAIAYHSGLTGFALGYFADWFGCLCVFGGLWALGRAYRGLSLLVPYVVTAALMSLGVLGWALWSGMELPLFFAIWCAGQAVYRSLGLGETEPLRWPLVWLLSGLGLLLDATRPEALLCVLTWLVFAWWNHRTRLTRKGTIRLFAIMLGPTLALLGVRAILNRVYTGEFADAGSIVKLEPLAPFYDAVEIAKLWIGNMAFQLGRITAYHAGDSALWGALLWVLVLGALWQRAIRREATLLFCLAFSWMALVANNEYVRYQNDRYTMAPLAWLVIAASLCVCGLAQRTLNALARSRARLRELVPMGVAALAAITWTWHQVPRLKQQNWLFGRASRNIAEQQVRLGLLLDSTSDASNHRILVGDAGAIQYFSNLPGIDAVGLGGTHGLPFARAVRLGIGAIVELIERLPPQERPDLLALYPSWWKELPLWFGHPILELDIDGNVICGAPNKVVYSADWRGLDSDSAPAVLDPGWRLVDELDIADLVSESAHSYELPERHSGYVFMKMLPHPRDASHDLFDAGRILVGGQRARFRFSNLSPRRALRLVVRAAPFATMRCRVRYDGRELGQFRLSSNDGWQESSLDVNPAWVAGTADIEVISDQGECNLFHIWALQPDK